MAETSARLLSLLSLLQSPREWPGPELARRLGYPVEATRGAHDEDIAFAIGARRIAPLWRLLDGIADHDWHDAIEMENAQTLHPGQRARLARDAEIALVS
jgi:hypothetical protein